MISTNVRGGVAAGAVGQLIPGRLTIGGGADRFLDTECATDRFILPAVTSAAPAGFNPATSAGRRTLSAGVSFGTLRAGPLSGRTRQYRQATFEGDAGTAAFFFDIDAPELPGDTRNDATYRLPSHAQQHGGMDVQKVGRFFQTIGDPRECRE